jgi:hypothetical protein
MVKVKTYDTWARDEFGIKVQCSTVFVEDLHRIVMAERDKVKEAQVISAAQSSLADDFYKKWHTALKEALAEKERADTLAEEVSAWRAFDASPGDGSISTYEVIELLAKARSFQAEELRKPGEP